MNQELVFERREMIVCLIENTKEARRVLERLPELGISIDSVMRLREDEESRNSTSRSTSWWRPWRKGQHGI